MELHKIERIDNSTDRIKVPNGWLYRTIKSFYSGISVHTIFIKDEESQEYKP